MGLKNKINALPKAYQWILFVIILVPLIWVSNKFSVVVYLIYIAFGAILYVKWVRWIANTAEKAGRSRKAFFWVGFLVPVIATFIVITLKPESKPTAESQ